MSYLNKLSLAFKLCFKFLNTPRLCRQYIHMGSSWQSFKVHWSIVILYTIQMVNHPSLKQHFPMRLFPYYNMLVNLFLTVCSWMFRFINSDITINIFNPTTSPARIQGATRLMLLMFYTKSRFLSNRLATYRAQVAVFYRIFCLVFSFPFPNSLSITPSILLQPLLAVFTILGQPLFHVFVVVLSVPHTRSITQKGGVNKSCTIVW